MQKLHDKIKNTTAMSDEEVRDVFNIHRLSSEDRWKQVKCLFYIVLLFHSHCRPDVVADDHQSL
jgi:hypothetical protein